MINFDIEIEGVAALKNAINQSQWLVSRDKNKLMRTIAQRVAANARERVISGKKPDGSPQKPLTSRQGTPLMNTGQHIRNRITGITDAGNSAVIGLAFKGARLHQFGGVVKPVKGKALKVGIGDGFIFVKQVKIPARPFLGISRQDRDDIALIVEKMLMSNFK